MSVSVQEMCSGDVQVHAEEILLCCRFFFYVYGGEDLYDYKP